MQKKKLQDIIPIYSVNDNIILSKTGDVTLGFRMDLPEVYSLSKNDYNQLHETFNKILSVMPAYSVLHKQDVYAMKGYESDVQEYDTFLSSCYQKNLLERPYLEQESYLFITVRSKFNGLSLSNFFKNQFLPKDLVKFTTIKKLKDTADQIKEVVSHNPLLALTELSTEDLVGTKEKIGVLERYLYLNYDRSSHIQKDIEYDKSELKVGRDIVEFINLGDVETLPSVVGPRINEENYSTDMSKFSVGFASGLGILLPCNHIYNQVFFKDDTKKIFASMEAKLNRLHSMSMKNRGNSINRDSVNSFLNQAMRENKTPVYANFNVMIYDRDKSRLNKVEGLVSGALSEMDCTPKIEGSGTPFFWWSQIPGNIANFPKDDTFLTLGEVACSFVNFDGAEKGHESSDIPLYLGERKYGYPVKVDLSDIGMKRGWISNRNKFILGPSGSGKSFFINHLIRSYYEEGTHFVLIDVGHSYQRQCEMYNGVYFQYDEDKPLKFNPFYLPPGTNLDTEKSESLKTLLISLWKKENEEHSRSEYVSISTSIWKYYEYLNSHSGIAASFNSYYEFCQNQFKEYLKEEKVREQEFDLKNYLYVLKPYYKGGEYDYLLNSNEQLDLLSERFILFELDNIKDHPVLFPIVTLMIMEIFIHKMRKLKCRKVIMIEEAWKAIANAGMAEYIKYLYKTVRKFFGEAIVVTQDVEDIISSKVIKQAIINNADVKILLDQRKYANDFSKIGDLLGLNEKERALALSMNKNNELGRKYKEVFISLGGEYSKVYRVEVSKEEYFTYTTERTEKDRVSELVEKHRGNVTAAIKEMVAILVLSILSIGLPAQTYDLGPTDALQIAEGFRVKPIENDKEEVSEDEVATNAAVNLSIEVLLKEIYENAFKVADGLKTYRNISQEIEEIENYIEFLNWKIDYMQSVGFDFSAQQMAYYINAAQVFVTALIEHVQDLSFLLLDGVKGLDLTDGERLALIRNKIAEFDKLQKDSKLFFNAFEQHARAIKKMSEEFENTNELLSH